MTGTPHAAPSSGLAAIRRSLEQARASLHAAAVVVHRDPDAALDDILAARLLIGVALLGLGAPAIENP